MKVIKRNGTEVIFDKNKITIAIGKANKEVENNKLTESEIISISDYIEEYASKMNRSLGVEEIQDIVEKEIVKLNKYDVAKAYIIYRYIRSVDRDNDGGLYKKVKAIVSCSSEEIKQENSNKDSDIISVQRDYIAGEVSKDMARKYLYPKYVMDAHDAGIIHKHDLDYAITHEHNCDLVNIKSMLNDGTVISGTKIDTPHSFSTACTILTQIIAQVASSQFGGQSVSISHLVPFVGVSREAIRKEVIEDGVPEFNVEYAVNKRLLKEIEKGVQTMQYQIITLMTTNGLMTL